MSLLLNICATSTSMSVSALMECTIHMGRGPSALVPICPYLPFSGHSSLGAFRRIGRH
jgi:hypothetical protein